MTLHEHRFPGETPEYRAARDALLEAERDLRERVEKVAAQRRALPLGALIPEDYTFEEGARDHADGAPARKVRLSELFAPGRGHARPLRFHVRPGDRSRMPDVHVLPRRPERQRRPSGE